MGEITEYLARAQRGKGKMVPWQDDIVALRSAGATYRLICGYLAEQGVTASPAEVHRFLRRRGRDRLLATALPRPQATARQPGPERDKGQLPKFEWPPDKTKSSW